MTDGVDSGSGYGSAVELRLCQAGLINVDGKLLKCPHGTGVELFNGLENGDTPMRSSWAHGFAVQFGKQPASVIRRSVITQENPIEGTGTSIARWSRVYDECEHRVVYLLQHAGDEERTEHQIRMEEGNSLNHPFIGESILDRDIVTRRRELKVESLRERVVGGAEEKGLHFDG